ANLEGSTFCVQCGKPVVVSVPPALATAYQSAPASTTGAVYAPPRLFYAGFWLRFVAYLIDAVILCFAYFMIFCAVLLAIRIAGPFPKLSWPPSPDVLVSGAVFLIIFGISVVATVIIWLYYAWMESSPSQGTLGKMAMGLIVTDMQYQPVSFARASGRFFAKFITGLIPLWIGYIMAGFTAKKQALHDMIASCLVLRKS
ncbi:MAG: RDD family protein, partial [Candidatus Acidiferrales bacterium]